MKSKHFFRTIALIVIVSTTILSCQRENLIDNKLPVQEKSLYLNQQQSLSVNLIAGQNIDAGDIVLSFDATNLYITYMTTGGWMLDEIHLWIGSDVSNIPMNPGKNPILGHFPYKSENIGDDEYMITIPLSNFGGYPSICEQTLYVAAHAAIYKSTNDGEFEETAWGEGQRFAKGNWAMYFGFTFDCQTVTGGCETAYGLGGQTFSQFGIGNNWGWVITVNQEGQGSTQLHAGAGQNNYGPNTLVGTLNWNLSGGLLTVQYLMNPGYTLNETHLFASTSMPTTTAPGLYGNKHENLNGATSDTYQIMLPAGALPVYMIAHAVVCEN